MTSPTLIVLSGLPGSGKSTVAEGLSRALSIPLFSIDPIEAAMWRGGLSKDQTGIAAYEVAIALADEHLRLGHSVIVDAVNPIEAPRAAWRSLAAKYRADMKIIECVCADEGGSPPTDRGAGSQHRRDARGHLGSGAAAARRIRSLDRRPAHAGYVGRNLPSN